MLAHGGVRHLEREAAAKAVAEVQREWLPYFEDVLHRVLNDPETDLLFITGIDQEIRRLRRALGLGPSPARAEREARSDARAGAAVARGAPSMKVDSTMDPRLQLASMRAGGPTALARAMKVPTSAIARWRKVGVEPSYWADMEKLFGAPPAPPAPPELHIDSCEALTTT